MITWHDFWIVIAVFCALGTVIGIIGSIVSQNVEFAMLFMLSMCLGCISAVGIKDTIPVIPCVTNEGDIVQWTGHSGGKAQDWWVYVQTSDRNKFCLVHSQALYNMGLGYKLGQIYNGELVNRP